MSTYQGRSGASSNIDVNLANALMVGRISDWKVEEHLTMSYHNVVHMDILNMQVEGATHNMKEEKYNQVANWPLVRQRFVDQPLVGQMHPNDVVKAQTSKIKRAVDASISRIKRSLGVSKKLWCKRLEALKRKARRLRRHYQCSLTERQIIPKLQAYQQAKKD